MKRAAYFGWAFCTLGDFEEGGSLHHQHQQRGTSRRRVASQYGAGQGRCLNGSVCPKGRLLRRRASVRGRPLRWRVSERGWLCGSACPSTPCSRIERARSWTAEPLKAGGAGGCREGAPGPERGPASRRPSCGASAEPLRAGGAGHRRACRWRVGSRAQQLSRARPLDAPSGLDLGPVLRVLDRRVRKSRRHRNACSFCFL